MIECILNHLDGFEHDVPQLDFFGYIHEVGECFGDFECPHLVDYAPQLCLVAFTIEMGESFDMFECPHSVVA